MHTSVCLLLLFAIGTLGAPVPARQLLGGTSSQLPTTMLAAKDSGASACVRPVHGQGGNFDCVQTSTVNVPKPLPGTAIVRMNVSSVNPSDVDIVEGKFGKLFGTLGADFSGNSSPNWLTLQPCHWSFAGPIPVFSVTLCFKPSVLQGSSLQWVHFAPSFRWAMQYGAPPKVKFPLFPSHTMLITCTCCDDQIKGTQDKDFSYSFSDSLYVLFVCFQSRMWLSLPVCSPPGNRRLRRICHRCMSHHFKARSCFTKGRWHTARSLNDISSSPQEGRVLHENYY